MRVLARIATLCLLACASVSLAQEETVVTATRIPTERDRLPTTVTVIDRRIIEERGYATLADALSSVPGMRLVQTGGPGGQGSLFIRGGNSRHVLVLRDGVPVNDASDPNAAFNFGTDLLADVERIEIVRSPASAAWGSSALSGVVNIISRRPSDRPFAPFGEFAAGSPRTFRGGAGVSGTVDGFDYLFSYNALDTRGTDATPRRFRADTGERDGFRAQTLLARVGLRLDADSRVEASVSFRDARINLDNVPNDDPNYTGDDQRLSGFVRGTTALLDRRWQTTLTLGASQDERQYRNFPDRLSRAASIDDFRGTRSFADWSNVVRLGDMGGLRDLRVTFGANWEREEVEARSGSPSFRTVTDASARQVGARGGVQMRLLDRIDVTALVRADDSRDFGTFTSWTLGSVLQIPEAGARLRASLGTGFKAPSLFQRFGRIGTSFRGNPDLRAEDSLAWEAGGEIDLPGLGRDDLATLSAVYFGSRVRDLINFNAAFNSLENIDRARIQGAELGLTVRPATWLEAGVAWTITDARDRATSARLPRRPRDQVSVTARVTPLPGVTLAPEVLYFGRSPEAAFASYTDEGRSRTARFDNKAGTIVNLTVTWRAIEQVTLFAEGRNLTDSRFEPANGFVIPGRSLLLGTRFAL